MENQAPGIRSEPPVDNRNEQATTHGTPAVMQGASSGAGPVTMGPPATEQHNNSLNREDAGGPTAPAKVPRKIRSKTIV